MPSYIQYIISYFGLQIHMTCIKTSMVNHTQYTDATQDGLRAEMFVKRLFPHVTDYKKKIYFWNSLR